MLRYKCQSLKQIIVKLYEDIRNVKVEISNVKPKIKNLICPNQYTSIINIFNTYCSEVKNKEKSRLQNKFDWLRRKL